MVHAYIIHQIYLLFEGSPLKLHYLSLPYTHQTLTQQQNSCVLRKQVYHIYHVYHVYMCSLTLRHHQTSHQ